MNIFLKIRINCLMPVRAMRIALLPLLAAEAPGRDEKLDCDPNGLPEGAFGFRFFFFYNKCAPPPGNTRRHSRAAASAGDARTAATPAGLFGKGD